MPRPHYAADGAVRTTGTSLHRGRIYRFRPGWITVIDPWPRPQAWQKADDGEWKACRPFVDLSAASSRHPASFVARQEAPVTSKVPPHVAGVVVDAHLQGLQWASLQLAARVPGGLELLAEAPVLGAALACAYALRPSPVKRPLRSARALLRAGRPGARRWRRIAGWLGFDDSAAFLRQLRRIRVASEQPLDLRELQALRLDWASPRARKLLLHAPALDHNVLALVSSARAHGALHRLHPDLVRAVFNDGHASLLPGRFSQLLGAWSRLHPDRPFPELRNARALDALHDELAHRARRDDAPLESFPPPPLPPGDGIEALDSPEALRAESRAMDNCLYLDSWAAAALRCQGFGYRVRVAGQRADVWLVPVFGAPPGSFRLVEARGPSNGPPPPECLVRVQDWLARHQAALRQDPSGLPGPWLGAWASPQPEFSPLDDIPF